ncbi:hypothetical protein D3C71_2116940 [compost metagenome]
MNLCIVNHDIDQIRLVHQTQQQRLQLHLTQALQPEYAQAYSHSHDSKYQSLSQEQSAYQS